MAQTLKIEDIAGRLIDDVIEDDLIERGGPGSGFHGHVGREGEVGGSAPEGTPKRLASGKKRAGRAPLPTGEGARDVSWKKNLMKPPTEEEVLSPEQMRQAIDQMQEISKTLNYPDWRAEKTTQAHLNRLNNALHAAVSNAAQKGPEETIGDEKARMLMEYVYELYWMTKFNIDHYGMADQLSDQEHSTLENIGFMIDETDYVPGYSTMGAVEGSPNFENPDKWIEFYDDDQIETWTDYEVELPDEVLSNPMMLKDAQKLVDELTRREWPIDGLAPFYTIEEGDEILKNYVSMQDYLKPVVQDIGSWTHPAVVEAVVEIWRERAMTNGTPEYAEAIKLGGADPEQRRFWIDHITAMFAEPQWVPNDELSEAINVGWVQNTSHPASILAMNSVARLFGDEFDTKTVDLLEHPPQTRDVRFQRKGETVDFLEEEAIDWIEDPERNAQADQFIEKMYETTQDYYQSKGYNPDERVVLYRGLNTLSDTDWNPTGEESREVNDVAVEMWPISSWTANEDEARGFSRTGGAIVRAEVPISRILCNAQTGFPCNHEQEVLVIGGDDLIATVYSIKDDDDAIRQGLSPALSGGDMYDPSGEPMGNILQSELEKLASSLDPWYEFPRRSAVSMGHGFSLSSDMMTPKLMRSAIMPAGRIYPEKSGGSNWMTDGLAALGLDRFKIDGIEEMEEGDVSLKKHIRQRGANSRKRIRKREDSETLTQRHYGPDPHPGTGTPQEVHGDGGVGVAKKPTSGLSGQKFSKSIPGGDAIADIFSRHGIDIELLEKHIANRKKGQWKANTLSEEEYKRWEANKQQAYEEAIAELEGKKISEVDRGEYIRDAERRDLMTALIEEADKAEEAGDEDRHWYLQDIWHELYNIGRDREQIYNFELRKAVSNGEVTPEEAAEIDRYDFANFEGSRPWKELPETLYHTTVAASAVREEGLKSRFELGGGQGLGGGNDQTISYTGSREWAEAIERAVQEVVAVARGDVTAKDLIMNAARGIGNNGKPWLTTLMSFAGSRFAAFKGDGEINAPLKSYLNSPDFNPDVPIPEGLAVPETTRRVQEWIDSYTSRDAVLDYLAREDTGSRYFPDPDELAEAKTKVTEDRIQRRLAEGALDLYRGPYLYARESAGGHWNPVVWGASIEAFENIDPAEIVTFQFKPKPGAMGGQMSALDEWRSYGGDNVDMVDELNLFSPEDLWTEKSLLDRAFGWLIKRGGKGSGYTKEAGHQGRIGEQGGSVAADEPQRGRYMSEKPGMEAYGSGVFTPMLKEVIYNWQGQPGWGTAQMIFQNVLRAKEAKDEEYQGLAIGQDGILQGIGALDYDADLPEGIDEGEYLKIDGLYTPDPAYSEELMVQMAIEAAKHGKGLWMNLGPHSGPLASQMGMDVVDDVYAFWTAEEVSQIAESLTALEPKDYFAPPAKPRLRVSFNDAFEETMPENPTDNRQAPRPISEMPIDERYRWENFNYSAWADPESWNPEAYAKERLGYDPENEEEFISSTMDTRIIEDIQNVHDGWVDGTDSPWSVRFSEAVASIFGGEPIPPSRPRDMYDSAQEFLEFLSSDYGADVVIPDDVDWYELDEEEKWGVLDEFHAFAQGARDEDIAADLEAVAEDIYEKTQAKLREAGYSEGDTVRLYRGLQSEPQEYLENHDGGWMQVQPWSISSWTAAKSVAGDFATMDRERSDVEGSGTLLTADVPIERILSMWQTGPGSHGEFEYLILGQNGLDAYATRVDAKRLLRQVKEGLAAEEGKDYYDEGTVLGPELE